MYHDHFGLRQAPFRITPDTRFFYTGGQRGEILHALVYAISEGEGFIKVVGEVGSGKTMLCRMLEEQLPPHVEIVYLANPSVPPESLPGAVAGEMGLALDPGANRLQVLHALQRRLLEKHAEGRRMVVFVEEAQSMSLSTLEELRLLSNLETQRDKLLQIVLFGQTELDHKLDAPQIRQLRERITHGFVLPPFDADEIRSYVTFRMRSAGYRGPEVFTRGAYRVLARRCEGLIRRINILADKSLLAAFADGAHAVKRRHVRAAAADSEFGMRMRRRYVPLAAAGALLLGALLGGWAGLQGMRVTAGTFVMPPWGGADSPGAEGRPGAAALQDTAIPDAPGRVPPVASGERAHAPVRQAEATRAVPRGQADAGTASGPSPSSPVRSRPRAEAAPGTPGWSPPLVPVRASGPGGDARGRGLLARRLSATQTWLARADTGHFSIQLLMTDAGGSAGLREFLSSRQRVGDLDDIYVYRTTIRGKTWFGVLYKEYRTLKEAREALGRLTPELRRHQPFIQNIRDVAAAG